MKSYEITSDARFITYWSSEIVDSLRNFRSAFYVLQGTLYVCSDIGSRHDSKLLGCDTLSFSDYSPAYQWVILPSSSGSSSPKIYTPEISTPLTVCRYTGNFVTIGQKCQGGIYINTGVRHIVACSIRSP